MKLEIFTGDKQQVIRWDNPIADWDGYTVFHKLIGGELVGQFAYAPICVTDLNLNWVGTWSANQIATQLENADVLAIARMQISEPEHSLQAKMNWVMGGGDGEWGSPLRALYPVSARWYQATDIRMITAIYADQWIKTLGEYTFTLPFNGDRLPIEMYEIRTFEPSTWLDPNAFQDVTAVDQANRFNLPPVGRVRLPIYFGRERRAFVFKRWLVN